MLENIDMDIILRITMQPQSVNLIFIMGIITTANIFLHACFHTSQDLTTTNLQQYIDYLSSTLHHSLFLSPHSYFCNRMD